MVNRPLATSISGSHQLASDSADKERPQYFFKKKPPHLRGGFIAGTSSSASETTRLMAAQFFQNDVIHDQRGSHQGRSRLHVASFDHFIQNHYVIMNQSVLRIGYRRDFANSLVLITIDGPWKWRHYKPIEISEMDSSLYCAAVLWTEKWGI